MDRYYARSASKRSDDWPFWFVADRNRGGLNVTPELMRELHSVEFDRAPFLPREAAETLAAQANGA
jgi:hypothetical protein